MSKPIFQFGNVVVVEGDMVGVIVKTWETNGNYNHEVYVRGWNGIKTYEESHINHFVYSKELADGEREFY